MAAPIQASGGHAAGSSGSGPSSTIVLALLAAGTTAHRMSCVAIFATPNYSLYATLTALDHSDSMNIQLSSSLDLVVSLEIKSCVQAFERVPNRTRIGRGGTRLGQRSRIHPKEPVRGGTRMVGTRHPFALRRMS